MYKILIRPLLFCIPPETVHYIIVAIIKISFRIPGVRYIIRKIYTIENTLLETSFAGLNFKNPVGLAAGFDKNAEIFNEFSAFGFGFIEVGTITPYQQPGNKKPRLFRLRKDEALINRMGFNNRGAEEANKNLKKKATGIIIGGNIGKNTDTPNERALTDYEYTFRKIYDNVDYLVVNVSCPNISNLRELHNKESLTEILHRLVWLRNESKESKPVFLKISPDLNREQIDETIEILKKVEIDGLIVTNTTIKREHLMSPEKSILKAGEGGLSGRPLTQRSNEMIAYIHQRTEGTVPIIGVGGIMSVKDALDKIAAGASLLQIYTGFIYEGPILVKRINKAILKLRKTL